ncbi:hypothetical protein ScPMuIL_002070 [Solemya velum]
MLSSLREKQKRRRQEREGMTGITPAIADVLKNFSSPDSTTAAIGGHAVTDSNSRSASPAPPTSTTPTQNKTEVAKLDPEIEKKVLLVLCDISLDIPCNASVIAEHTCRMLGRKVQISIIEELLQTFENQELISIKQDEMKEGQRSHLIVHSLDLSKLSTIANKQSDGRAKKRKRESVDEGEDQRSSKQLRNEPEEDSIESLLNMQSARQKEERKVNDEILQLLSKPTAKEQLLVESFKSQGGPQLQEFCNHGTREECKIHLDSSKPCGKLHFRKIIHKHTDESLGDCSFLNTCFHMDTCKYVHYEIDYPDVTSDTALKRAKKTGDSDGKSYMFPPQWIQCDMRYLDMTTLGKCAVIMADPPWDIHMELPYGTMSDDEMRKLPIPTLQDDGFIFLWVTGRAMELGRECLDLWGYKRIDELIWVKTNQLQRIIRTGRTGHWLNHGKEHCLVGVKGNPKGVNKGLDCDVIVAEVRATSHKPDEVYGIIERLSPGTRKVELFGRPHNVQPNWITLGNQLDGVHLKDPDIVRRFREKYPDGNCMTPPKR